MNVAGKTLTQKADYEDARLVDRRGTSGHQGVAGGVAEAGSTVRPDLVCRRRCCRGTFASSFVATLVALGAVHAEQGAHDRSDRRDRSRSHGAVVPDAEIQITDQATGISATAKSAATAGSSSSPFSQPLHVDRHRQGLSAAGRRDRDGRDRAASNIALQVEVAGVQEAVEVAGRATVIETSSTISTTVTNRRSRNSRWGTAACWRSPCSFPVRSRMPRARRDDLAVGATATSTGFPVAPSISPSTA